ncbi:hypothetical protein PHLCEN_2v943 [Hermanssonia centrifuga]|uniref:Aminoglycoside phosphotransferase domain-containing protein n=1 Tax=Hermanssonia centrifuga TaxID=98765 RepID=A0A2R6S4N3_9APHY|nr:hypothetical protein PHLCEN_2v943 [Hermanssonia centrifuga]
MRAKQGLPESVDGSGQLLIHKITANVVVKRTLKRSFEGDEQVPHEALAMNFVQKHTSIPVPRVLRIIDNEQLRGNYLYVMEFIDGQQLGQVWPTLSMWGNLRVSWTLRSYICQLRKATSTLSSVPGPLGGKPQVCVGFVFEGKHEVSFLTFNPCLTGSTPTSALCALALIRTIHSTIVDN